MTVVPLQCPLCQGAIQVDTAHSGAQVACPHCQGVLTVPDFGPEPPTVSDEPSEFDFTRRKPFGFDPFSSVAQEAATAPTFDPAPPPPPPFGTADEFISLTCPLCGGLFQAPLVAAGQQVACPHCAGRVTIPALGPPPSDTSPAPPSPVQGAILPPAPDAGGSVSSHPLPPGADLRSPAQPPSPRVESKRSARKSSASSTPAGEVARDDRLPPQRPRSTESTKPTLPTSSAPPLPAPGSTPAETADHRQLSVPEEPSSASPGDRKQSAAALTKPEKPREKKERRGVDDLLPPGARPTSIDARLPPGQSVPSATTTATSSAGPTSRATALDTLLPPGADDVLPSEVTAGAEVAIPDAPRKMAPLPSHIPPGALVMPTPDGGYATIRKKAKTIGQGDDEIELKELSPEEKAKKRFRYNLVMWSVCVLILLVVFLVLAWPAITK